MKRHETLRTLYARHAKERNDLHSKHETLRGVLEKNIADLVARKDATKAQPKPTTIGQG